MGLAVVRRVSTWEEAVVMASALRSAGISAEVFDILGQVRWTLQTALGGFRVMVPAIELRDARAFLSAPLPDVDGGEPTQPSTPRRVHIFAAMILMFLFG